MMKTPVSLRPHIGIFGRVNSGKSTLMNLLTGQRTSLVSEVEGTTTDTVRKSMEIHGVGPLVFLDTPGFSDSTKLGEERIAIAEKAAQECSILIYILSKPEEDMRYLEKLSENVQKLILVERAGNGSSTGIPAGFSPENVRSVSHIVGEDDRLKGELLKAITELMSLDSAPEDIFSRITEAGDHVLLVMPQDASAPEGRLIMPQVQTIRRLLDRHCMISCVQPEELDSFLPLLKKTPDLVITDSQCFRKVFDTIEKGTRLTSFSVLMSAMKGDLSHFMASVKTLDTLEKGTIVIAEACTHPPETEDIGTVKIPALLKKRYGDRFTLRFSRGTDLDLDADLIIHCGACMFTREYMMNRLKTTGEAEVPMTNYGITIAHLTGILEGMDDNGIIFR